MRPSARDSCRRLPSFPRLSTLFRYLHICSVLYVIFCFVTEHIETLSSPKSSSVGSSHLPGPSFEPFSALIFGVLYKRLHADCRNTIATLSVRPSCAKQSPNTRKVFND